MKVKMKRFAINLLIAIAIAGYASALALLIVQPGCMRSDTHPAPPVLESSQEETDARTTDPGWIFVLIAFIIYVIVVAAMLTWFET